MKRWLMISVVSLLTVPACGDATKRADAEHGDETAKAGEPDLLELMRQLEQDMARLDSALLRDDFSGVAEAANAIANHPRVSASERDRIQGVLGDDFANFVRGDQLAHKTAAALAAAAKAEDLDGVLRELDTLTRSCVSCHEDFRARLRPGS